VRGLGKYTDSPVFMALVALIVVAVAATTANIIFVQNFVALRNSSTLVFNAETHANSLLTQLREAETAQRGYLLTGDEGYLQPYHAAAQQAPKELTALAASPSGLITPDQLKTIRQLTGDKLAELDETIKARQEQGLEAALAIVTSGRGQDDMSKLRTQLGDLAKRLAASRGQSRDDITTYASLARGVALLTLALTLGLAILVFRLYHKAIEAERELDRAKDEFVSLASHQLRTPASGIKSILATVLAGDFGALNDRQRHFLGRALESNERELNIIEELLNVAKADAGRLVLRPSEVDLRELIRTVLAEQRRAIDEKRLKISVKQPNKPLRLLADREKLYMAIGNLVDNARKYTPEEGKITITVHGRKGMVAIEVTDTGMGIDEADLAHVFDRFKRANSVLEGSIEGTGLGLYLARRIVELHRGNLQVNSRKGRGSTFIMTLPAGQS
jgi:signal transduction histidine kinase